MSLFLSFFLYSKPTAHPLQWFQMKLRETQREAFYDFWFLWLITAPILSPFRHFFEMSVLFFLRDSVFENVPNGFCILGPCVNRHLTSSGDWGNLYHPTQFSVSFPLAVALWLTTYVYVPVAFLLKGQLQTVQTFFSFSFFFLLTFIRNNVTI